MKQAEPKAKPEAKPEAKPKAKPKAKSVRSAIVAVVDQPSGHLLTLSACTALQLSHIFHTCTSDWSRLCAMASYLRRCASLGSTRPSSSSV